jgi:YfiH family protein
MATFLYETSKIADGNLAFSWGEREEVLHNQEAFLNKFGKTRDDCVFMETEHEDKIVHVGTSDKGKMITCEALITKDLDVVLFLLTADCFPVTFYDSEKQIIALAHMGWRPTGKQLATKVVRELKDVYGSQSENIKVFIGPGIHKESYVFDDPEQKKLPEWSDFLIELPGGQTQIDLISYIHKQLLDSGVTKENIQTSSADTATSSEYFSHYRAVRAGEPEGRFATIVSLI